MDTPRLNTIISSPLDANSQDLKYLEELANKYPFAQFLRILISKISQNLDDLDQINRLNSAAIFSADRSILKSFITQKDFQTIVPVDTVQVHNIAYDPNAPEIELPEEEEKIEELSEALEDIEEPADPVEPVEEKVESEEPQVDPGKKIFTEVLKNLSILKTLRNEYKEDEKTETKPEEPTKVNLPPQTQEDVIEEKEETAAESDEEPPKADDTPVLEPIPTSDIEQEQDANDDNSEDYVEKTKPDLDVSDPNYQKTLIESFIDRDFLKAKNDAKENMQDDEPREDLSLTSIVYESDIVSENLAGIFVNQGKKEKAIEIYKKLIWKFPQKKAYFAARIQELKG